MNSKGLLCYINERISRKWRNGKIEKWKNLKDKLKRSRENSRKY